MVHISGDIADLRHAVYFHFSNYVLDTGRRELRCGDQSIEVEPQVLDLLIYLMQNNDRVITKDDLIDSVWGGRIVSDTTLTSRIYAARRAIGDSGRDQKLIRTIQRKGLRFIGAVSEQPTGIDPLHSEFLPRQEKAHSSAPDGVRRA